ncbi:MAG: hypothetical protein KGJ37_04630, partial [Verrucomicrobiota bacterium]|nr:hypothetical protein [Verrucomicrobiota bacterium]
FVASVQRGPEALLLAAFDPKKPGNPAGKGQSMRYESIWATFVLPDSVELWDAHGRLSTNGIKQNLDADTLFLRFGGTAAALRFVLARDDEGRPARLVLAHDGDSVGAQRFTAILAEGKPRRRVVAAVWIRATEGLADDAAFADFRRTCLETSRQSTASIEQDRVSVTVPGVAAPLKLTVDLKKNERLAIEDADPALKHGILNVNGRDLGADCLK